MNIATKAAHGDIGEAPRRAVEEKLAPIARLLGAEADTALLELELERAPAEGRSAEPYRLVANLKAGGAVYHAEAVKPSPESAADRVRRTLEAEIRKTRGREKGFVRRGGAAVKRMFQGWGR